MPFEKVATVTSGASGDYHRINRFKWDPVAHVFQCSLDLYTDEAAFIADPVAVLVYEFAKFRSSGGHFDSHLSKGNLEEKAGTDLIDIVTWAYELIQNACDDYISNSNTIDPEAYLVCDLGHDFYADATIVYD